MNPHPLVIFKSELDAREQEFKAALPAHIPVERFIRVVTTAVQNVPALLTVERRSLFNAAVKAAQDGLLPDGREGAIIPFEDKDRGWIAVWMPMIAGIRKKVRNSGEVTTFDAYVVCENDRFAYRLGDDPFIEHEPALINRGKLIAAYSIATLKGGEKSREVMNAEEIAKVRAKSRAKRGGPWFDWPEEMWRKTVARRHSKMLPSSTDLDDLLRRDDELYDLKGAGDAERVTKRPGLAEAMERLSAPRPKATPHHALAEDALDRAGLTIEHDPETGEIRAGESSDAAAAASGTSDAGGGDTSAASPSPVTGTVQAVIKKQPAPAIDPEEAYQAGRAAHARGDLRKAVPADIKNNAELADAWRAGFDAGESGDAS